MAARTPKEVFEHHAGALEAGDVDSIVADYNENAVIIASGGVVRGKKGIREAITKLLAEIPEAAWRLKTEVYEGDLLLVEWAVDCRTAKIEDGVDIYVQGRTHSRPDRALYPAEKVAIV